MADPLPLIEAQGRSAERSLQFARSETQHFDRTLDTIAFLRASFASMRHEAERHGLHESVELFRSQERKLDEWEALALRGLKMAEKLEGDMHLNLTLLDQLHAFALEASGAAPQ